MNALSIISPAAKHPAKCPTQIPSNGIWLSYILCCADQTLYTGITNDLAKRLAAHNAGNAAKYTRARGPVELVFVEICADKSCALKREIEIKKLSRAQKLALIRLTEMGENQ